jgi:hypothetical protein
MHLHADGVKTWAPAFTEAAARYRAARTSKPRSGTTDNDEESEATVGFGGSLTAAME